MIFENRPKPNVTPFGDDRTERIRDRIRELESEIETLKKELPSPSYRLTEREPPAFGETKKFSSL